MRDETQQLIWQKKHQKYADQKWIDDPSLFAEWAVEFFPVHGDVLDIGTGQGQDARFFAEKGYTVTGIDFSEQGLAFAKEKTQDSLKERLTFQRADISESLPFANMSFDVVYSHLSLHYFDMETTKKIFTEIHRVLKENGVIVILLNSTNDSEFNTGEKVEEYVFQLPSGMIKRFFDIQSLQSFTEELFETIVLDDNGETYKDRAIGVGHLIRFVGRKRESIPLNRG